jgi:TctA family transporter
MKRLGYSPAALVLGPLAERALRQSLIISDAGVLISSSVRSRPSSRRWRCRPFRSP